MMKRNETVRYRYIAVTDAYKSKQESNSNVAYGNCPTDYFTVTLREKKAKT